jgi:hypothetical protein
MYLQQRGGHLAAALLRMCVIGLCTGRQAVPRMRWGGVAGITGAGPVRPGVAGEAWRSGPEPADADALLTARMRIQLWFLLEITGVWGLQCSARQT